MANPVQDLVMPEYALAVLDSPEGERIMLEVSTSSTRYVCVLASKENYKEVANKLREQIMRLGAELTSPSRLIQVQGGLPDGLRNRTKEGR